MPVVTTLTPGCSMDDDIIDPWNKNYVILETATTNKVYSAYQLIYYVMSPIVFYDPANEGGTLVHVKQGLHHTHAHAFLDMHRTGCPPTLSLVSATVLCACSGNVIRSRPTHPPPSSNRFTGRLRKNNRSRTERARKSHVVAVIGKYFQIDHGRVSFAYEMNGGESIRLRQNKKNIWGVCRPKRERKNESLPKLIERERRREEQEGGIVETQRERERQTEREKYNIILYRVGR